MLAYIKKEFIQGFKKLFPNVKDEHISFKILSKEKYAGILIEKGFLKNLLPFETPFNNLFVLGMFNIYPERALVLDTLFGLCGKEDVKGINKIDTLIKIQFWLL